MRLKSRFDREAAQLDTEIEQFIRSAVTELKAKNMQIFFVNQRNDDLQTTVTVTGLNAVDKPMVASMLASGFHLIDTRPFGLESMAVEGFEPVAPTEVVLALGTHAREEQLVLPEELAAEAASESGPDLLWPFDFETAEALQTTLSEVFKVNLSVADAETLFALQTRRAGLAARPADLAAYQQAVGQIAAHYADSPQDFVSDLMIAPQGRWLLYRQVLTGLRTHFAADTLQALLEELKDKQLSADEISALVQLVFASDRPAKPLISAVVQRCEQAMHKLDADFQPGDAPDGLLAFLKWYADLG